MGRQAQAGQRILRAEGLLNDGQLASALAALDEAASCEAGPAIGLRAASQVYVPADVKLLIEVTATAQG